MNATLMRIADHLKNYGFNFFSKCHHYKTAHFVGSCQFVKLLRFCEEDLTFWIEFSDGKQLKVPVTDLDEFVL